MFESIASLVGGKAEPDVSHHLPAVNLAQTKVRVDKVCFTGITDDERAKILHKSSFAADGLYDRAKVEQLLNDIYGTNVFESVTYYFEGNEEPFTLVFDCQKGQVNDFALSLRADTDEAMAAILHLGLGTRRLGGPRLTTDLKLGTNPAFSVDWAYKSRIGIPTVGVDFRSRLINTFSGYMSDTYEKLLTGAVDVYLEDSRMRFGSMRAGLTAEMDPYEHYLRYGDDWLGWDWKSYWLSAFATFKFDTFNDGYFPTWGVRLSFDGRYVFKGYTIDLDDQYYHSEDDPVTTPGGIVPDYLSTLAAFEGAFSIGDRFTILPKLYVGWYWVPTVTDPADVDDVDDYINPKHIVTAGGFLQNRYTERQIPFFGYPTGFRDCQPYSFVGQVDLRYRFGGKNFLTARAGVFADTDYLTEYKYVTRFYAYGLDYARQTMVGPLKIALQWGKLTKFSAYASIGFDF